MSILRREIRNPTRVYLWCPGCRTSHVIAVEPHPNPWTFNGDTTKPTFQPSLLVTSSRRKAETVCHSFVTDGQINFLPDTTAHELRGLHPIPDWPKESEPDPAWFERF